MGEFIRYTQDGPVVTLTMNEPQRRNPLTGNSAVPDLLAAFDRIHADRGAHVVILTGEGSAFCTGGDLREMQRQSSGAVPGMELRQEYTTGIQRVVLALYNLEVPVIAAVNGPAMGGGMDLACMCDIRIASESAKFAESFVKLGLISGDGGAWMLPRLIGLSRASEMSFTGETIDAQQGADWGLVSRVVPAERLMETATALAAQIAANPPDAVRLSKRLLRDAAHTELARHLELAAALQVLCHQTAEHREALNRFKDDRSRGAQAPSAR